MCRSILLHSHDRERKRKVSERRWELGKKSRHFFNLHLHNSNEWEKYDREISALFQHTVKNILIFFCCSTHVSFSHLSLYLPSSHHLIVDTATQHSISKNKNILSTSDKFNLKRVLSKKRKKSHANDVWVAFEWNQKKCFLFFLCQLISFMMNRAHSRLVFDSNASAAAIASSPTIFLLFLLR